MKRIYLIMLVIAATMMMSCKHDNKIAGHEYVDLGLPSGLKWATCNVGANSPEEYGNLLNFYDACDATWGGTWRTPTFEEYNELISNCSWVWTTQYDMPGYKVTGANGNSIFLHARFYLDDDHPDIYLGLYWTSTENSWGPCRLYFDSSGQNMRYGHRSDGHSVRLVAE